MLVSKEQFKAGLARYLDEELGRKADGISKFAVYFMIPRVQSNATELIDKYKDNPLLSDMFEDDQIDIDKAYESAKDAMRRTGKMQIMNVTFNEDDIESLYRYIMGG